MCVLFFIGSGMECHCHGAFHVMWHGVAQCDLHLIGLWLNDACVRGQSRSQGGYMGEGGLCTSSIALQGCGCAGWGGANLLIAPYLG